MSLAWGCYHTRGSTKLHSVVALCVAMLALILTVSPTLFIQEGIQMTKISTINLDNEAFLIFKIPDIAANLNISMDVPCTGNEYSSLKAQFRNITLGKGTRLPSQILLHDVEQVCEIHLQLRKTILDISRLTGHEISNLEADLAILTNPKYESRRYQRDIWESVRETFNIGSHTTQAEIKNKILNMENNMAYHGQVIENLDILMSVQQATIDNHAQNLKNIKRWATQVNESFSSLYNLFNLQEASQVVGRRLLFNTLNKYFVSSQLGQEILGSLRERIITISELKRGNLNPRLLPPDVLRRTLQNYNSELLKAGIPLQANINALEFYYGKNAVKHVFINDNMYIYLKILYDSPAYDLILLDTHPVPVNKTVTSEIVLPTHLVAVNPETNVYFPLTETFLRRCDHVQERYICHNTVTLRHLTDNSCLSNILKANTTGIFETCQIEISRNFNKYPYIASANDTHSVVYNYGFVEIRQICLGEHNEEKLPIAPILLFENKCRCYLYSPNFKTNWFLSDRCLGSEITQKFRNIAYDNTGILAKLQELYNKPIHHFGLTQFLAPSLELPQALEFYLEQGISTEALKIKLNELTARRKPVWQEKQEEASGTNFKLIFGIIALVPLIFLAIFFISRKIHVLSGLLAVSQVSRAQGLTFTREEPSACTTVLEYLVILALSTLFITFLIQHRNVFIGLYNSIKYNFNFATTVPVQKLQLRLMINNPSLTWSTHIGEVCQPLREFTVSQTVDNQLILHERLFNNILRAHDKFYIKIDGMKMDLPQVITVPQKDVRRVKLILAGSYMVHLLIGADQIFEKQLLFEYDDESHLMEEVTNTRILETELHDMNSIFSLPYRLNPLGESFRSTRRGTDVFTTEQWRATEHQPTGGNENTLPKT